jgi:hypothetical protein
MMRPCSKCLENNWRYAFDDATGRVTATCQFCGAKVAWLTRKKPNRPINPEKFKPVSLRHHLYIPGPDALPVDRPENIMPWED